MIVLLGIISFAILNWAGYETSINVCAIIGAILAIPGGIIGAIFDGILGFSITGLLSTKIGSLMSFGFGRFLVNAVRSFFIPFIVVTIFYLIIA
ncbi:MAG: hypothetical protein MJ002_00115 [Paludibacteraceae bacterium]|nr:hypothetical protein [Paludibacteraceae bacterium]